MTVTPQYGQGGAVRHKHRWRARVWHQGGWRDLALCPTREEALRVAALGRDVVYANNMYDAHGGQNHPFHRRLWVWRLVKGIRKQSDMARRLGIDQGHYSRIESGRWEPSRGLLVRLADVLGLPLDRLVGRRPPAEGPEPPVDGLPAALRRLRRAAGLSQYDLAPRVGLGRLAYCQYELGRRVPSLALACRMARALGVTVDDLLGPAAATG